jgi:hypothetical protein
MSNRSVSYRKGDEEKVATAGDATGPDMITVSNEQS